MIISVSQFTGLRFPDLYCRFLIYAAPGLANGYVNFHIPVWHQLEGALREFEAMEEEMSWLIYRIGFRGVAIQWFLGDRGSYASACIWNNSYPRWTYTWCRRLCEHSFTTLSSSCWDLWPKGLTDISHRFLMTMHDIKAFSIVTVILIFDGI